LGEDLTPLIGIQASVEEGRQAFGGQFLVVAHLATPDQSIATFIILIGRTSDRTISPNIPISVL
jgi:hypothetical protein